MKHLVSGIYYFTIAGALDWNEVGNVYEWCSAIETTNVFAKTLSVKSS